MLLCVLPWLARCRCHLVWWVVSPAASEAVLAVLGTGWVWAAAVYACVCGVAAVAAAAALAGVVCSRVG